jgi:PTS system mannose-specific IIA component
MIKIIIITHGQLGDEFYKTAESIVGKQEETLVLSLGSHEGLTSLHQRTGDTLKDVENSDGALILTDMLGGTPCNACLPFSNNDKVEIVSGVNLYMLLSAFINRKNMPVKELAAKVISDGQKNIANAKDLFLKKLKK